MWAGRPFLPFGDRNQVAPSCHLAPLIQVKMEGRPRHENGGLQRWLRALPPPTPDPVQAQQGFCHFFIAWPTFCFSLLLGFIKPFTMNNLAPLSYFNKFVFACSLFWGVTMDIACCMYTSLNFSWKGGAVLPQLPGQVVGMKPGTKAE